MAVRKGDMKIVLGQKVTAIIDSDSYNLCIRGWLLNEYIVMDIPKFRGQPLRIPMESRCHVRYVRDGVVCMFDTSVLTMFLHSVSFMLLTYPNTHEKIKLRKVNRLKSNISATYSEGVHSVAESAALRDLTLEGALMVHSRPLVKTTKIMVNIEFPNESAKNLQAVVRNIRHNPKNIRDPYVTGIKFTEVSSTALSTLQKFLENQMIIR